MRTAQSCVLFVLASSWSLASSSPVYSLEDIGISYFSEDLRVSESGIPYLQDLSAFATPSFRPSNINSAGQIIGTAGTHSHDFRAVLYNGAVFDRNLPFSATAPAWTLGLDISDGGDFLGGSTTGKYIDIQIIQASGELILTGLSSYRHPSFNSSFNIVGADVSGGAFFYDGSGSYFLEDLVDDLRGFTIRTPTDISDSGFIVGYGLNSNGEPRGFLLSPHKPEEPPNKTPAPSSLSLLLPVFLLVAFGRSRHSLGRR